MTDKQIIIDAQECEFWQEGHCDCYDDSEISDTYPHCIDIPDCYYKQLKQAEQRIVELNKTIETKEQECEELKKIIDEAKNTKLDLKSFLVGEAVQNEYEQQLDQLKAELEQYKNVINKLAGKIVAITSYDKPTEFCDHKDLTIQQLKAESEELKNAYARLNSLYNDNCNFTGKLEQTLTEIKEIAEDFYKTGFVRTDCGATLINNNTCIKTLEQILQKISECEVGNE